MELSKNYIPNEVEANWYEHWLSKGYFNSVPDQREPYTIVIPPPNVTGVLHMGHCLNNTIQDILIRYARMHGKNACWVPGTDHASIATEAKVVGMLRERGITKSSLSREEFLTYAWEWKEKYGGIILQQLKKLGCSLDWNRTSFTMDADYYQSVLKVFVNLYEKGLIYRGKRMVNWDPQSQTALSDEEVIFKEVDSKLYYVVYKLANDPSSIGITVATTRPETILGDIAICVNPNDERYQNLIGKEVIVPLINRKIPIIADDYVTADFGTGALKVTPAHDKNDHLLGLKHQLKVINTLDIEGKFTTEDLVEENPSDLILSYKGVDRFALRKKIVEDIQQQGLIEKIEAYKGQVGTSERTGAVIEHRLSLQWFIGMEQFLKKNPQSLSAVMDDTIQFHPAKAKNTYSHWLSNIKDWCISRQLWWGQRIPAWYDEKGNVYVAESLEQLHQRNPETKDLVLTQDEDVLDTWFSSWLWPMAVFGGIMDPENEDFKYYYPTNDLVTGPDILFFWVARMIIAGYKYTDTKPFKNVYLTGLVRDSQGRKMSKSLGNSPEPLGLIEKFGADGVRVGLLLSASAGNDILFDEELCNQGKAFTNKIWNAFKLIKGWEVSETIPQPESSKVAIEWYEAKLQQTLLEIEDNFEKYRLSEALMATYKLVWDDFCSWFLEMIKPGYQQPIDKTTFDKAIEMLENNLKLLHPFMPFLTEEIWQHIAERTPEQALIVAEYPKMTSVNTALIADFDFATDVISGIRTIRKDKNIPFKDVIELRVVNNEKASSHFDSIIMKLGNITDLKYVTEKVDGALSYRVKSNEYFIPITGNIDVEAEIAKLTEELNYTQGFLKSVQIKLSNEKFVAKAKPEIIENERKKEADALAKITTIEQSIAGLK